MDGTFVCSFEQRSTRKKRIYDTYPKGFNHLVYFTDYLIKRVIPKFLVMDKIYFNITQGKNRILSKTEVLGRLVYCGFDIVETKKLNGITYVIAKKIKNLDVILVSKRYGPLLTLRRLGKNGKVFDVYKFRTMYSYAEYLQAYIYRTSRLQKGGKFNKDIRVNTMGKFMRKYWIDELPMFINLLKGEMKLVGVRPLSQHYFSLYSPELQKMRVRYKPGLLPPFYADMPETLEEIQESEFRYLKSCEQNGIFLTDMKYLVKILRNILIKRVKSA
jgi:lipopolysaccharide/colanic/teichoic acid biosynthesis glycosyltransferase